MSNDNRLYLYYKANEKRIHLGNFSTFSEIFNWCDTHCEYNSGRYYYKGNLVLCGYHLGR